MLRKNVNKKIYHSLTAIILIIVIFAGVTFIKEKNVPDRWLIKYKFVINEKALIYLNNLDAMTQDFKITKPDDPGLISYVIQMIGEQTEVLTLKLNDIYGIRMNPDYIFFETKNINNSTDDISKIIKTINKRIKNDLTIKLNLYNDIAEDRVEEEKDMTSVEGYLNYIKQLVQSNEEITISVMQDILRQLNNSASGRQLNSNALGYIFYGIDKNIQLDQLKKRSKELLDLDILQGGYIADSKNIKTPISKKIIVASILGLVISLIYVYFYLTVSLRLLKKKLTFLLYQEK
tara:strand:+ start:98 stop:967 length:870 start_codon:yes stop_codon:yes gene_type:complete